MNIIIRPWTRPVMIVALAQIMPQIVSAIRGPNLSATQPPLIWNKR